MLILLNCCFLGAGDDENALVDNEEAQAEEVPIFSVLIETLKFPNIGITLGIL